MSALLHLISQTRTQVLTMLLSSSVLIGCQAQQSEPELIADRTACSNCKMLISETAYAAAYRVGDKDLIFDDIGCMLERMSTEPTLLPEKIWVKDLTSDVWIDATKSSYAFSKAQKTPMGFGYVAYSDPRMAIAKAAELSGVSFQGIAQLQEHHKQNGHVH
jgi:nitrous oxide reductase accessory protein NosL